MHLARFKALNASVSGSWNLTCKQCCGVAVCSSARALRAYACILMHPQRRPV